MLLNLVYNVIQGIFPSESLRVWLAGSQACEQLFRLLRSMTSTFSTMVNFSLKGILEKIHKLEFINSSETNDQIIFPRLKRRLMQTKEESNETFRIPTIEEITSRVAAAKAEAIRICSSSGITLKSYSDGDLIANVEWIVEAAICNDEERIESAEEQESTTSNDAQLLITQDAAMSTLEELSIIKLRKDSSQGLPIYKKVESSSNAGRVGKTFCTASKEKGKVKFPFLEYDGCYIRKSTALYLLQENFQVSGDRLLRVRAEQPNHIYTNHSIPSRSSADKVNSGDLCIFSRLDSQKYLLGRAIQVSYLSGSKRARQYSSTYVDMTKESVKNIGVLANWFQGTKQGRTIADLVAFKHVNVFTAGYISMENYVGKIDDSSLVGHEEYAFCLPVAFLNEILPQWSRQITFDEF